MNQKPNLTQQKLDFSIIKSYGILVNEVQRRINILNFISGVGILKKNK